MVTAYHAHRGEYFRRFTRHQALAAYIERQVCADYQRIKVRFQAIVQFSQSGPRKFRIDQQGAALIVEKRSFLQMLPVKLKMKDSR